MAAEAGVPRTLRQAGLSGWLLAAFCGWAVLVWIGAWLGMGGRVADAEAGAGGALPQATAAAPDRIGPLAQYSAAAARPLFTEDRRPRSFLATIQDGDGQDPASNNLDFLLTGVLISPQVRLAILQPTGGGESQRVREGSSPEGASGWRLVEVQPRRALFEGAAGQASLDLRTYGDAAAPPVPIAMDAADHAAPPPPPPPPPAAVQEGDANSPAVTQARIEAIRRRIEARRAQLRNNPSQGAPRQNAPQQNNNQDSGRGSSRPPSRP